MNSTQSLRVADDSDVPRWRLRMNAKQAWVVLTPGVVGYEIACREGQLLSEGVGDWLISRPILTRAAIAVLALHLRNAVPNSYDSVALGFQALRQSSRLLVLATAKLVG